MSFEFDDTLLKQARGLPRYYQARVIDNAGVEEYELGLEIANKALAIVDGESFNINAVDELYERFQEVKDRMDGSASIDLNYLVDGLKRVADAQRKQS